MGVTDVSKERKAFIFKVQAIFYLSVATLETAELHTTESLNSQLHRCEDVTPHSCLLLMSFINVIFHSFVFECNILLTPPIISFNFKPLLKFAENT